jgi:putative ABC transport system permease protein
MNKRFFTVKIAFRYLSGRKAASIISASAIALSLVFLSVTGSVNYAMRKGAAERSLRYPLVIGPSGTSGAQIILGSLFHMEKPSGIIPFSVYEKVSGDKRTLSAYPLAMADSLKGIPIIGTDIEYVKSMEAKVLSGSLDLSRPEFAVLGSSAAERLGLGIGDTFHGSHGMVGDEEAHEHSEITYVVKGVLSPVNGPEDSAIYIDYKTIWLIHRHGHDDHEEKDHHEDDDHGHHSHHDNGHDHDGHEAHHGDHCHITEGNLTAVIVKTRNPAFTAQMEREYSAEAGVQAVDSGLTMRRLSSYMNRAESVMEIFSGITVVMVSLLIFVTIIMSLNERKHDLALMRSLGLGRRHISSIIMTEVLIITAGGALAGILFSHSLMALASGWTGISWGIVLEPLIMTSMETRGIIMVLLSGQMLSLFSLLWIYRMDLTRETSNR